jgi:hypothetical protein
MQKYCSPRQAPIQHRKDTPGMHSSRRQIPTPNGHNAKACGDVAQKSPEILDGDR